MSALPRHRLAAVNLDEASLATASREAEQERKIAIFDLIEANRFEVEGEDRGPYALDLSIQDGRLVFDVRSAESREPVRALVLSLAPFRRIIKDYFYICDTYHQAIRTSTAAQIETIDMARRGLHNEGSDLLSEKLAGKFKVDFDTSRRLFTLICALHVRM